MKKTLVLFFSICILLKLLTLPQNVSAAASCPDGYTLINVSSPVKGDSYFMPVYNSGGVNILSEHTGPSESSLQKFIQFRGTYGKVCYKLDMGTQFYFYGTSYIYSYNGGRSYLDFSNGAGYVYKIVYFLANNSPIISNTVFPSYINSNNVSNVGVTISGITDSDSGQTLTYKYQLNGGIWNDVGTGGTPKSNFDYTFTLDATSWPEGNNTISFKVNDGFSDSNVITKNITKDTIVPVLSSGSIASLTNDSTPNFYFYTTEAGNLTYYGNCISNTNILPKQGDSMVTFNLLNDGIYNNCSIVLQDLAGNNSNILVIPSFIIDTTPPSLPISVKVNNGAEFTNNKSLNLEILHTNESDVDGWCTTEDTFNECIWQNSKPNTYQLKD